MKSPVAYGAGRINMKGKKEKVLSCGCCIVYDFRDDYKKKLDEKEIRDAKSGLSDGTEHPTVLGVDVESIS